MIELWDVYDENGNVTDRTMPRGIPAEGEYMLCVHVYIYTPDKKFLMQKRSEQKQSHPGVWDTAGGAVLAGETGMEGAIRETAEEVGVHLEQDDMKFVKRFLNHRRFADIYFVEKEIKIEDCVIQEEEVQEIRLVSVEEMLRMERESRKRSPEYMQILQEAVEKFCLA